MTKQNDEYDEYYKMLLTVPRKKPIRQEKSTVHMQF